MVLITVFQQPPAAPTRVRTEAGPQVVKPAARLVPIRKMGLIRGGHLAIPVGGDKHFRHRLIIGQRADADEMLAALVAKQSQVALLGLFQRPFDKTAGLTQRTFRGGTGELPTPENLRKQVA